jgi:hypothetical protein
VSQPGSASESEIPVTAEGQTYLVQRQGGELRVGRTADGTVLWQDETVPVADLPDPARTALDDGRHDAQELQLALEAIVTAFVKRGG